MMKIDGKTISNVKPKVSPLGKRLRQALKEVNSGKTIGPFSKLLHGMRVLKRKK